MCSDPAFCAWRRLPLICLKLLWSVCVYKTGLLLLFAYDALQLIPLRFFLGVDASSLPLAGLKNENSPLKTGCARRLLKKKPRTPNFFFFFFGDSVTPMSTLANNKRFC